jgi:cyclic pyranopterin phosphate synthase
MVDVGAKAETRRRAVAEACLRLPRAVAASLPRDDAGRAALLTTAVTAGVLAAKQTSALIPMCHPLPLSTVAVQVTGLEEAAAAAAATPSSSQSSSLSSSSQSSSSSSQSSSSGPLVRVRCTAVTTAQTGVEMEALTGATVAALTLYDMLKSAGYGIEVERVRLLEKSGGKGGAWSAPV